MSKKPKHEDFEYEEFEKLARSVGWGEDVNCSPWSYLESAIKELVEDVERGDGKLSGSWYAPGGTQ